MKKLLIVAVMANLLISGLALASVAIKQFGDVEKGSYYEGAVDNMVYKGVVKGYDDGFFHPNDLVSRAQVVTMLDRYDQQLEARNDYLEKILCNGFTSGSSNDASFVKAYQQICEAPVV